jgi:hypothetical protein
MFLPDLDGPGPDADRLGVLRRLRQTVDDPTPRDAEVGLREARRAEG